MANLNQSMGYSNTSGDSMRAAATQYPYLNNITTAVPNQFPYTNNNLIMNSPYENYMNRAMMPNQYLKCRPVSSKEEARAFQIDLDGSLWVFTDVGNNRIYTKQINNDGTAAFKTYVFSEDENAYSSNNDQYVTKSQFNKVIQSLIATMQTNQQKDDSSTPVKANGNKPIVFN